MPRTEPILTGPQRRALTLLNDGWQACWMGGPDGSAFLQQGKVGHGGKAEPVRKDTLAALYRKGFIRRTGQTHGSGSTSYVISPGGQLALAGRAP